MLKFKSILDFWWGEKCLLKVSLNDLLIKKILTLGG